MEFTFYKLSLVIQRWKYISHSFKSVSPRDITNPAPMDSNRLITLQREVSLPHPNLTSSDPLYQRYQYMRLCHDHVCLRPVRSFCGLSWAQIHIQIHHPGPGRKQLFLYFSVTLFHLATFSASYYVLMINIDISKEANKLLKINSLLTSKIQLEALCSQIHISSQILSTNSRGK